MANRLVHQLNETNSLSGADGAALRNFIGQHTPFINWLKSHFIHSIYAENQELILEALTHSSFSHENKDWPVRDNERLEFLGDAVLDAEISKRLFKLYPNFSEGQLSRLRSAVVNEEVLARFACVLKVDEFLMLGKGESSKKEVEPAILADAFEAIIGALYMIDESSVSNIFEKWIELFNSSEHESRPFFCESRLDDFDPKTRLQEICLEHFKIVAHYKTELKNENAQEALFISEVFCQDKSLGTGIGSSKKKAQGQAAKNALQSEYIKELRNK